MDSRAGTQPRWWRAVLWTLASDGAANLLLRGAGPLIHGSPLWGAMGIAGGGIGWILLWARAVKSWVPVGPTAVARRWDLRVVFGWALWMACWGGAVVAIIGAGYASRHVWDPQTLRIGMIATGLMVFSALGMVGTVAMARGQAPFVGRAPSRQVGRWVAYWALLTAADALVLTLGWMMIHHGWWMGEWGGGILLAWSIVELWILVGWART